MREYKFRAWDADNECMAYSDEEESYYRFAVRNGIVVERADLVDKLLPTGHEQTIEMREINAPVMQYTGIRNVWEGDVYRTADGKDTGIIKYENARFYIDWLPPVTYGLRSELHYVDDGEVIGNIHNHPHLQEQGEKE